MGSMFRYLLYTFHHTRTETKTKYCVLKAEFKTKKSRLFVTSQLFREKGFLYSERSSARPHSMMVTSYYTESHYTESSLNRIFIKPNGHYTEWSMHRMVIKMKSHYTNIRHNGKRYTGKEVSV